MWKGRSQTSFDRGREREEEGCVYSWQGEEKGEMAHFCRGEEKEESRLLRQGKKNLQRGAYLLSARVGGEEGEACLGEGGRRDQPHRQGKGRTRGRTSLILAGVGGWRG